MSRLQLQDILRKVWLLACLWQNGLANMALIGKAGQKMQRAEVCFVSGVGDCRHHALIPGLLSIESL
jgi:hypothetical protein